MPPPASHKALQSEPAVDACLELVRQLKEERDTWRATAMKYKDALAIQNQQLREFQDICFATQAELENERLLNRPKSTRSGSRRQNTTSQTSQSDTPTLEQQASYHTAFDGTPFEPDVPVTPTVTGLGLIEHLLDNYEYSAALSELDSFLRGSLIPESRIEGLLLKSTILRASGSEWVYDALAQCSEAFELCKRVSSLESYLPKIRHAISLCYSQLRMLPESAAVSVAAEHLYTRSDSALDGLSPLDLDIDTALNAKRRLGFDEKRSFGKDYISDWTGMERRVNDLPHQPNNVLNVLADETTASNAADPKLCLLEIESFVAPSSLETDQIYLRSWAYRCKR